MKERISIKAELSEWYTNHCIRTSTVTSLFKHSVDARKICAITKHNDEGAYPLHQQDNNRTKKRVFKDFKGWHISATTRCSARSFRNHEVKCFAANQPVLAQTQTHSLLSKTNLFPWRSRSRIAPNLFRLEHWLQKVWRTAAISQQTPPNNRERW